MTGILHLVAFMIVVVTSALIIPMVLRCMKLPDTAMHIFQGILLSYAVIFGFIIPFTTWLSASVLR